MSSDSSTHALPASGMSLRTRIVWYLLAIVLVYASGSYAIQKLSFLSSFADLEVKAAREDVQRVVEALTHEQEQLALRCADLAEWDETYHYMREMNAEFVKTSLSPKAFERNRLDVVLVCDMKGKVLFGRCADALGRPLTLRDFNTKDLGANHPLITSKVTGIDTGIWMTESGAMLVSAKPILDSQGKGPVRGTVVVGRLLTDNADENDTYLKEIRKQTGVDFEVWRAESGNLGDQGLTLNDVLTADDARTHLVSESRSNPEEQLFAYAALDDIAGKPALVVVAKIERHITAQGATTVRYALVSTMLAGILMVAVLLYLLQTIVLGPIAKLTAHAVEIGAHEDTTKKLGLQRDDEIGILSREFDGMMDKLAESRAAVVKAARHAGMSEIATGVLHNVGNVLNSVNVSATLVAEKARSSGVGDLKMAMDAVREASGDLKAFLEQDPRGEHLYPLLVALTDQIQGEQQAVEAEVKRLSEGIDHIKLLVQSQQTYAGHTGVLEMTSLQEQVEAALEMTGRTVGESAIEIVREFAPLPSVRVDRHKLMEVLVNLVQNARQALQAEELTERKLTVRIRSIDAERVAIDVADTGVGIPAENLERIFTHGFTTKKNGHGFGLHASANAATEMGGKLTGTSDGPGRGACFTVEFPVRARVAAEVAA